MWNETHVLKLAGESRCMGGEKNGKRTKKWAASPSALSQPLITIQLYLQWQDVGFVCPVSVSCVLRGQSDKRLCVKTSFVCIQGVHEAQIYLYWYFHLVFPKLPVMDTFNMQFCKPTDMPMYFSVFLGQKHAAYSELYLSLCTYGNMIQYAVQLFCFLGISIVPLFPPVSAMAASH